MAQHSNIEWTDATWNPIVGCSIVSPGCTNCYAMAMAARIDKMTLSSHYEGLTKKVNGNVVWTGKIAMAPDHFLTAPLRWKKPKRIFVNSMGDLFHEDIPDEWIDKVFAVMALGPQHTFQVLTKRAARMRAYLSAPDRFGSIVRSQPHYLGTAETRWPLPNAWLGISAERQEEADERIPHLLQTPAAVRFVSCEPLLGAIDLEYVDQGIKALSSSTGPNLDWIIVGGESGPKARPMKIEWAESLIEQCRASGVRCFVKQLGACAVSSGYPLHYSGKGGNIDEWPDHLKVRELPSVAA